MIFKEKCKCKYIDNQQDMEISEVNMDFILKSWLNKIGNLTVAIDCSSEYLYLAGQNSINMFQKGYIGDSWKTSWVVFGKWIGDPIIYNLKNKEILTYMHGVGEWNPYPIAPSLEKFDLALSAWCSLYHDKYNGIIYNDDFEILNEFIADLRYSLLEILDIKYLNGFLKFINS